MPVKKNVPVITGYYRYTDVWFQWREAVSNTEDANALKALLAHDALVHPDHPLHPGVLGITMYIGTFPNGESRLLMTSAQCDYIRYWLHAMRITKEMIPLPYSDCLLTRSNLAGISPIEFRDGFSLKNHQKVKLDKQNKKLTKGNVPGLPLRRQLFQTIRSYWGERRGVWCAIDIEEWELDHSVITEFGYSLVRWENGQEVTQDAHLLVEEHLPYTNKTYVQGNRDHYNFGSSEILTKVAFKERIRELFDGMAKENGPIFLVFHDWSQDVKHLQSTTIAAPISRATHILPDAFPDDGTYLIDTSTLIGALLGSGDQKKSLLKMCNLLGIHTKFLHNAGNDAHYTMQALKSMASGPDVDAQREQRWPPQDGKPTIPGSGSTADDGSDEDESIEDMFPAAPYNVVTGRLNDMESSVSV